VQAPADRAFAMAEPTRTSFAIGRRALALATVVALLATMGVLAASNVAEAAVLRDVDWVRTGGSTEFDYGRGVGIDAAGNTYVAAQVGGPAELTDPDSTFVTTSPSRRPGLALIKYAPAGDILWLRSITSTGSAYYGGFDVDATGAFVVAGSFTTDVSFGDPPNDLKMTAPAGRTSSFVVHYDSEGTVQWTRSLAGTGNVSAAGVSLSASGVAVAATFAGTATITDGTTTASATAAGSGDLLVAHLDAAGTPGWTATSPSTSGGIHPRSVTAADDGTVVAVGSFDGSVQWDTDPASARTSAGGDDAFALAFEPAGTLRWIRTAGSTGTDQAWSASIDPNGAAVAVGGYVSGQTTFGSSASSVIVPAAVSPSAFIATFDLAAGSITYAKAAAGPGPSMGTSVSLDVDGEAVLGGLFAGPVFFAGPPSQHVTSGQLDGFVATFDATGAVTTAFAPSGNAGSAVLTLGVAIDADGTIASTGAVRGPTTFTGNGGSILVTDTEGGADIYAVRLPVHLNHAPKAKALTLTTITDAAQPVTLLGDDPDGDAVTFSIDGTGPSHGSLTGVPPNTTYTPEPSYEGPAAFTYPVTDVDGATATATVTIDVENAATFPHATSDDLVTVRNRATPLVLHGTDPAASPLTYALATPPSHGTITGTPPNITYTPATDYLGTDAFDFTITNDRAQTTTGTISIVVKQPNIVMIMTDDQTLEQQRWLPRTNALIGAEGTTFSNYIVSYSECCPSRATFLSGQYAHNHGVLSSMLPSGGVTKFDHANSLAPWLQANGYYTALSGKYMNGYGTDLPPTYVPPGWNDWYALYEPSTYEYFNYDISVNGVTEHHARRASDYSTDVLANRVDQQIRAHGGGAQPFFIDYTPTGPHVTAKGLAGIAAPRHAGTLSTEVAPRPPNFGAVNPTLPFFIRQLPAFTTEMLNGIDNIYRIDAETLLSVDDAVQKIYDALRDTGELDNTILIFTSDNGLHFGDRRMVNAKSDPYEESIRVPLLIRGPGFPAGAVVSQPTGNIDLAPTITEATGTTPGRTPDGVSLTNFVANPAYGVHRSIITENGPLLNRRTYKGIRDDHFVYIAWGTGEKELYDLVADPFEMNNLANVPARQLQVLNLDSKLRALQSCVGTACRSGIP
jgi:arylsulfatase A-like enzyme